MNDLKARFATNHLGPYKLAPQIAPASPLYRFIKRKRKDDEFEQIVEQSVQRNH